MTYTKLSPKEESRKILRDKLMNKINERRIMRNTKESKEIILEKTLNDIGIDKEKFKADLEAVKKQGGLQINLKQ